MNYYMPFDCETGGFNPKTSDLLTLYICIVDEEFKLCDELNLKLKPDGGRLPVVEAQALAINKINIQEHLANPETVTYSEAKAKIVAMIRKYLKKNGRYSNIRPMGYNVPFDTKWCQEHLIQPDEWESMLHYKSVDVMAAVDFLKEVKWFPQNLGSLGSVVEYLQLPVRGAHDAKEDILMTLDVHKKLIEIMASKKENSGTGGGDLISLLEAE
jgi:oligoribonuclease (3'-5' exoribonuclease)